jgi:hypothetical protein
MPTLETPPGLEEFEISLFGPGVGESVAVHLGHGDWLVVDSCIDRRTSKPAVLDYFEQIRVQPAESVRAVVVSHWHDDHIKGIATIARAAPNARVVCSSALRCDEFMQLLGVVTHPPMRDTYVAEMRTLFELLRDRAGRSQGDIAPVWAIADRPLCRTATATVHSLSPSDVTFTRFLEEISALLPAVGGVVGRAVSNEPNETAVVVWVEFGEIHALLGSDLERGSTPNTGWQAILASTTRPQQKARFIKVPHHGSEGADHDGIWTELMEDEPYALLTPFRRSGLPKDRDQERLLLRTVNSFCAARPYTSQRARRAPTVEKLIRRIAPDMHTTTGPMGHIRLRFTAGMAAPTVELFGPAYRLQPASN